MSPFELAFIFLIILPVIPMAFFKQWRLFWVFITFYVCFGLQEWLSVSQTGMTISQHFWIFDRANPGQGWIIVICMLFMWVALLFHFKDKK